MCTVRVQRIIPAKLLWFKKQFYLKVRLNVTYMYVIFDFVIQYFNKAFVIELTYIYNLKCLKRLIMDCHSHSVPVSRLAESWQ